MGRDKAWVEYQGKPLLSAALEKLRSLAISEVFVSGRPDADYRGIECRVLLDSEFGIGPMAGIERALWVSRNDLVLVLPVDLPKMTAAFLMKLIGACDRLTGAVAVSHARVEPLVAVYPKRCHEYARMNVARGNYAVSCFVEACRHERAVRCFRVSKQDAACFHNCNTPQDLAQLQ